MFMTCISRDSSLPISSLSYLYCILYLYRNLLQISFYCAIQCIDVEYNIIYNIISFSNHPFPWTLALDQINNEIANTRKDPLVGKSPVQDQMENIKGWMCLCWNGTCSPGIQQEWCGKRMEISKVHETLQKVKLMIQMIKMLTCTQDTAYWSRPYSAGMFSNQSPNYCHIDLIDKIGHCRGQWG